MICYMSSSNYPHSGDVTSQLFGEQSPSSAVDSLESTKSISPLPMMTEAQPPEKFLSHEITKQVRCWSGLSECSEEMIDLHSRRKAIQEPTKVETKVALYTFCDMAPNIVDAVKSKKPRKYSREFNKRRRRSTASNGCKIRRSMSSDFDEVASPLTLELQEILSDVIKNVSARLDGLEEEIYNFDETQTNYSTQIVPTMEEKKLDLISEEELFRVGESPKLSSTDADTKTELEQLENSEMCQNLEELLSADKEERLPSTASETKACDHVQLAKKLIFDTRRRLKRSLTVEDHDVEMRSTKKCRRSSCGEKFFEVVLKSSDNKKDVAGDRHQAEDDPKLKVEVIDEFQDVPEAIAADFEDEIVACNDFEDLQVVDGDVCSESINSSVQCTDCRVDLVDVFRSTPVSNFYCCSCKQQYSVSSDLICIDLTANVLIRVCSQCMWYTKRKIDLKEISF